MNILLPALAVAFAALCVWLTVRIVNRRERWAKWALAVVVMLAYPLSFGPACWGSRRVPQSSGYWEMTDFLYSPILRVWWHGDQGAVGDVISWYANLGANRNLTVAKQLDDSFCLIETFGR